MSADPMTTETAAMFMRQRDEALAERDRLAEALRGVLDIDVTDADRDGVLSRVTAYVKAALGGTR